MKKSIKLLFIIVVIFSTQFAKSQSKIPPTPDYNYVVMLYDTVNNTISALEEGAINSRTKFNLLNPLAPMKNQFSLKNKSSNIIITKGTPLTFLVKLPTADDNPVQIFDFRILEQKGNKRIATFTVIRKFFLAKSPIKPIDNGINLLFKKIVKSILNK